jgi:hypothetical protein
MSPHTTSGAPAWVVLLLLFALIAGIVACGIVFSSGVDRCYNLRGPHAHCSRTGD